MASGKMDFRMGKVFVNIPIVASMTVSGVMANLMVLERSLTLIIHLMTVIGTMEKLVAKVQRS